MLIWGFPDGSVVKRIHLPMQETLVGSLGGEDPLEEEMAIHFSLLARKIPWTEAPGELQSMGSQRVRYDWVTEHAPMHAYFIGYATYTSIQEAFIYLLGTYYVPAL